ncbi:MAG TPA: universal stress protein [Gemmatimonadaceae bacterium]|jgi:nucleotide-binding universal stress UspA family protein|nr:universal stress protein [Gemmatimonadaceae bacterium]
MGTLTMETVRPEVGVRAAKTSPVIVATDGRDQSDAALVAGGLLAGASDERLRVITVLKPMPIVSPEAQLPVSPDVEASRRAEAKRTVREQLGRVWNVPFDASVEVYDGDPATTIANVAHESNASMIVSGLGRHRVMDRLFGDETALRLIRVAAVPVLAVGGQFTAAPTRIVVAIDFSETSLRAARLALELAAPAATIYLAHVAPRDATLYDWNGWGSNYKQDAGEGLQRMREQLRVPADMIVQRVLLQGDPATELLAFAASVNADLIATGSHGHGFVARMLIGSVTTRILRCSTCSVLTVPHAAAMTRLRTTVEPPVVKTLDRPEWTSQLDEFTRRNVGRRGVLEVDDPELGAQAQEHDYPFLGATYDRHDGRVELMLGELGDVQRHLTRGIGSVSGIDVLTNERGRDLALRIAHGAGQTLLTFS